MIMQKSKAIFVKQMHSAAAFLKKNQKSSQSEPEKNSLSLRKAIEKLGECNTRLDAQVKQPKLWAESVAKEIYDEIQTRDTLRNAVEQKVLCVKEADSRNEDDERMIEASMERVKYLHYMRIACQFMDYQTISMSKKISEVKDEIKEKDENYKMKLFYLSGGKKVKQKVMAAMENEQNVVDNRMNVDPLNIERDEDLTEKIKRSDEKEKHSSDQAY
eukprot:TRINITY_DN10379_c0_g1_i3.p1 TRINITY_DN10379_c0_g1~~TRINITY_DN10379_c0_g1_i3.p1  ORF type:complete len:216 (-),score=44.53 TRINITY_DN10379_c0_g1_i3:148-795(-)